MNYRRLIKNSIKNVVSNKLRTGLALLGIIIGIASVIVVMSLADISRQSVQAQIQSMGSNVIMITPGSKMIGLVKTAAGTKTSLTLEDSKAIATANDISTVEAVSPEYVGRAQVIFGRYNTNTQIVGVTTSYVDTKNISLSSGDFFTESQNTAMSRVAIIGSTIVDTLFLPTSTNPLNQKININGQIFQVIGVLSAKGAKGNQNQDDTVLIPLNTAQKQLFAVQHLSSITVKVTDESAISQTEDQIQRLLNKRHNVTKKDQTDFYIQSQQDIINAADQVSETLTRMLTSIAAISLVVGGVGIMNMMLMMVTERTQEIGLRKALGATKDMIAIQFLIEGTAITLIGGVLGVMCGLVCMYGYIILTDSPWNISIAAVALSLLVSTTIGVIFSWYPAKKAADLQPIDALRYV